MRGRLVLGADGEEVALADALRACGRPPARQRRDPRRGAPAWRSSRSPTRGGSARAPADRPARTVGDAGIVEPSFAHAVGRGRAPGVARAARAHRRAARSGLGDRAARSALRLGRGRARHRPAATTPSGADPGAASRGAGRVRMPVSADGTTGLDVLAELPAAPPGSPRASPRAAAGPCSACTPTPTAARTCC